MSASVRVRHIGNQSVCSFSLAFFPSSSFLPFSRSSRVFTSIDLALSSAQLKGVASSSLRDVNLELRTQCLSDVASVTIICIDSLCDYIIVQWDTCLVTPLSLPDQTIDKVTKTATLKRQRRRQSSRRCRKLSQFPHRFRSKLRRTDGR